MRRTGRVLLGVFFLGAAGYLYFFHEPEKMDTLPPERVEAPFPESSPDAPPGVDDPSAEVEDDLTEEELARIAAELASEEPPPASVSGVKPGELVGFWLRCLSVKDDQNLRTETIEAIRQALRSGDPVEARAALQMVFRLLRLGVDAGALRILVRPHLTSQDAQVRGLAVFALHRLEPSEQDREQFLAMTGDASDSVRIALARAIGAHPGPRLTDREGEALLEILATDDRKFLLMAAGGITAKNLPPRLEARILDLARDPFLRLPIVATVLASVEAKSSRVMEYLIDLATGPEGPHQRRALIALLKGVPISERERVGDIFAEHLRTSSDHRVRFNALQGLLQYGRETHLDALQAILEDPETSENQRKLARTAISRIRQR